MPFDLVTIVVVGSAIVAVILLFALAKFGPGPSMVSAGLALMLSQLPRLAMPYLDKMLGYAADQGMAQNWADAVEMTPLWVVASMRWMVWIGVVLIVLGIPGQIRRNYKINHNHGPHRTLLS